MPAAKAKKADKEEKANGDEKANGNDHIYDDGKYTYIDSALASSVHDILTIFENSLNAVRPMPLEWLHDSLQAGRPLPAEDFLGEEEVPPPEEAASEETK